MKKGKLFLVLGIALLTLSSWYFTLNPFSPIWTPALATSGNNLERVFTVTGLSPQPHSKDPGDPAPLYRVYVFPGDGNYIFGVVGAGLPFTANYTYPANTSTNSNTYTPFTEAVEAYGDGDLPPARSAANPPVIVSPGANGGTISPAGLNPSLPLIIIPVRKIVPGHDQTYIVSLKNAGTCALTSCTLEFDYDAGKLQYLGVDQFAGNNYSNLQQASSGNNGTVTWTFSNMPKDEQRNIFLRFHTVSTAQNPAVVAGAPVSPVPTVKFIQVQPATQPCDLNQASYTLSSQSMVESSHDPNHKTVSPAEFCLDEGGDLTYLVTFQNDGPAPVRNVHIEDKLDTIFSPACYNLSQIQVIESSPAGSSVIPSCSPGGAYKIDLLGVNLRGTGERDYERTFNENDTKGYVKFRIPKSCLSSRPPCSAVLNRAKITFDCNPPMMTNLAISRIRCSGSSMPPPANASYATASAFPCTGCTDSTMTLSFSSDTIGVPLLPNGVPGFDLSQYTCRWYPPDGISNAFSPNATLTDWKTRTYTLVASKACERLIIYRQVNRPCSLALQETHTMTVGAGCIIKYHVVVSTNALSLGLDVNKLEWQNCNKGPNCEMSDLAPGKYYFSVKDPTTGCYAEMTLNLPDQAFQVTEDGRDCSGNPVCTGGVSPYHYDWSWKENGVLKQLATNGGLSLNLAGKQDIMLTVTDANGCSVVLPVHSTCSSGPFTDVNISVVIGILVAVVGAILGWRFFGKKRRP